MKPDIEKVHDTSDEERIDKEGSICYPYMHALNSWLAR